MNAIQRLRQNAGFTQESLAQAIGVSTSTVQTWEQDKKGREMFVTVAKLCAALGCYPGDLVDGQEISCHEVPVEEDLCMEKSND